MSQFLKEMIGKKPTIMSESIGTNNWLVVDVDEEWVKLSMTDKKGQTKTKLIRIEDIRSIEL
ncbi:aspartyl-tRNA synthetase [Streptococcus sanguinis]|uniref:aspartyl-tRNA synthetase n=1 Tax=Streptococcus sanguinis TaxID=1305 RepID=UPI001CC0A0D2|nr:aspartyl-tRNA synthetase [Streptococcus sanguinis]